MFTGLVSESGSILADPEPSGQGGVRLAILHSAGLAGRLGIGASLAVSGVCLTVTDLAPVLAAADEPGGVRSLVEMSPETLARTTLGSLAAGDRGNPEPALRMGAPPGGRWVRGHVRGPAGAPVRPGARRSPPGPSLWTTSSISPRSRPSARRSATASPASAWRKAPPSWYR